MNVPTKPDIDTRGDEIQTENPNLTDFQVMQQLKGEFQ